MTTCTQCYGVVQNAKDCCLKHSALSEAGTELAGAHSARHCTVGALTTGNAALASAKELPSRMFHWHLGAHGGCTTYFTHTPPSPLRAPAMHKEKDRRQGQDAALMFVCPAPSGDWRTRTRWSWLTGALLSSRFPTITQWKHASSGYLEKTSSLTPVTEDLIPHTN